MRSVAPLSFRRDLTLFLGGLIGFLVVIILALVLLLSRVWLQSHELYMQQANLLADAAVHEICATVQTGRRPQQLDDILTRARLELGIPGITVDTPEGTSVVSGVSRGNANTIEIRRDSCRGPMHFVFDTADLNAIRRQATFAGAICAAAACVGTLLLLFYLPRIVRPIEQLLDEATKVGKRREGEEETDYLLATFRASIRKLQEQEAELRRQHEREKSRADTLERITTTLTRSMTSGLIALNNGGMIVTVNSAAAEILAIPPADEMPPATIESLLDDSDFARTLRDAFDRKVTVSRVEVPHAQRVIGLTTVPLVADGDVMFGMLALFTDLTAIRELETRVRDMRTFADLGEVSAGIAHEFRNSLSTVLGYLRLVRRSELSGEAQGQVLGAEREVNALADAVEALLHFARPMRLERQPVDLRELATATVERLRGTDADIEWSIEGDAVEVEGDRTLLMRALENVIRNAVDAVRAASVRRIAITIASRAATVVVRVTDSGCGVEAKDVPRLFLPFQSDKSTGFGLGLPLAKKIILLHGGSMTLAPNPDRGASVTIELPRLQD